MVCKNVLYKEKDCFAEETVLPVCRTEQNQAFDEEIRKRL
jgi:hypothetical protein